MRRTTIALLAALEASVAALIGLGIALVPLMLLWALHFGLAVDAAVFLRAAADVWLLGHGVDLVVQLDPVTAGRIALPGAGDPFPITIALLGFALITVAFGRRIGRRSAAGGHSFSGGIAAVVVFALAGAGLALAAGVDAARADPLQAALIPAGIVALGVVLGAVGEVLRTDPATDAATGVVRRALAALPPGLVAGARAAVRIGAGAAFGVLALAAVLVAVLIVLDYATIAALYQALGAGVDGGIALTVAELALLPNIVIWAAAWLLGPGFAIGTGSLVSTGGTLLGPVPGIPLLGALPTDTPALGALWLVVPVLLGFVGAWVVSAGGDADRDVPRTAGLVGAARRGGGGRRRRRGRAGPPRVVVGRCGRTGAPRRRRARAARRRGRRRGHGGHRRARRRLRRAPPRAGNRRPRCIRAGPCRDGRRLRSLIPPAAAAARC